MQKTEQRSAFSVFKGSDNEDPKFSDEQKISMMDKFQAELLAKGLPLTFIVATLYTIYKALGI